MSDHVDTKASRFYGELAVWAFRWRWALFLAVLLVTVFFGYQAANKLRIETSMEIMQVSGSPAQVRLDEFRDYFGRDDYFLVLIEGDVFTMPFLEKLKKVHEELEKIDIDLPTLGQRPRHQNPIAELSDEEAERKNEKAELATELSSFGENALAWGTGGSVVEQVTSLVNFRDVRVGPDGIDVAELMDPWLTEEQLPEVKKKALADTAMVGNVVGKDGRHAVVVVRTQFMSDSDSFKLNKEIQRILKGYDDPGFKTSVGGLPALNDAINELAEADGSKLSGILFAMITVWLLITFRSFVALIAPLTIIFFTFIWTFGFMGMIRHPITIMSNILPVFFTTCVIAEAVHLIEIYAQNRGDGKPLLESIKDAYMEAGVPCTFTAITTAAGFFAFVTSPMDIVVMMGIDGGMGVVFAFIITMLLLPFFLSFNKKGMLMDRKEKGGDSLDKLIKGALDLSGARRGAPASRRLVVVAVVIVLSSVGLFGMSKLRTWHNPLTWIPSDTPIRTIFDTMDTKLGGTVDVKLLIEPPPEIGMRDIELLKGMEKLEEHVKQFKNPDTGDPLVGNVQSLVGVMKEMNRTIHDNDQAYYKLPDTDAELADLMFMFESAGPDELRKLATTDRSKSQMTMRIQWTEAGSYRPFAAFIDEGIAKYIGDRAVIKPTGTVYNLLTTIDSLIYNTITSFGWAFLTIGLMMLPLFRNVTLTVAAMLISSLPILFVFGYMGLTGWPLDMGNLLIAAVAMGETIDNTIHNFYTSRRGYMEHGSMADATVDAMEHVGRGMIDATLILFAGFSVYLTANTQMFRTLGILFMQSIGWTFLLDLFVGPVMLRFLFPEKKGAPPSVDLNKRPPKEVTTPGLGA
jgi:uncharacterized protein